MAEKITQPIYLITDGGALRRDGRLISVVCAVLEAGQGNVGFVQLREQAAQQGNASDREVLSLAEELLVVCKQHQAKLIMNRRCDLARASAVDGVHLGASSVSIEDARRFLGKSFLIGYSAHSVDSALQASQRGADYIFLSPIFSPLSKQDSRPALGCGALAVLTAQCSRPVFALGGISTDNAALCLKAGASGIAVIGSIFHAHDPALACRELIAAWSAGLSRRSLGEGGLKQRCPNRSR